MSDFIFLIVLLSVFAGVGFLVVFGIRAIRKLLFGRKQNEQGQASYNFNQDPLQSSQNVNFNQPRKGMVACKTCGTHIAKNAKSCPNCGADRSNNISASSAVATIILIFLIALAVSHFNNSKKETENVKFVGSESVQPQISNPVYTVGDTLEMKGILVTLKSVRVSYGKDFYTPSDGNIFLVFELNIENNSSESLTVSSIFCFDAYADDYSIDYSFSAELNDGQSSIDGTIASGKKINGIVGFEAKKDWQTAEIRFKPIVWNNDEFVFYVRRSQAR